MANYRNTAEGGTPGSTITAGSGGDLDGSVPWDTVLINTGGTLAWDNTRAVLGSLSHKVEIGATAGMAYTQWSTGLTYAIPFGISCCYYFTANPGTQPLVIGIYTATGTRQTGVNITTAGLLGLGSNAGGNTVTSTSAIALNSWFRIELKLLVASATVGQAELRYFANPFSSVPTETVTGPATMNTSTGTPTIVRFGILSSPSNVGPFWQDEFQASDTGYPPPPGWRRDRSGLYLPARQAALMRASTV